jgi:hypothetical protein
VWVVCGATALVAAVALAFVPRQAFTDRAVAVTGPVTERMSAAD